MSAEDVYSSATAEIERYLGAVAGDIPCENRDAFRHLALHYVWDSTQYRLLPVEFETAEPNEFERPETLQESLQLYLRYLLQLPARNPEAVLLERVLRKPESSVEGQGVREGGGAAADTVETNASDHAGAEAEASTESTDKGEVADPTASTESVEEAEAADLTPSKEPAHGRPRPTPEGITAALAASRIVEETPIEQSDSAGSEKGAVPTLEGSDASQTAETASGPGKITLAWVVAPPSASSSRWQCAVPGSDCDRVEESKKAMMDHRKDEHNVAGSPIAKRV